MSKHVNLLYKFGAKEVHIRIGSPPITHPCFYGINTPTEEELIASTNSVEQIQEFLSLNIEKPRTQVSSLGYLSHQGLIDSIPSAKEGICDACVTGNYQISVGI
jgi:amidophosphoribosyltransferase